MNNELIKIKIKKWLSEENFEILQETNDAKTYFSLTIKSVGDKIHFPINVISSKQIEGLIFGFSGKFSPEDHKSFLGTNQEYREKVIKEVGIGAALANLDFILQSSEDETIINGTAMIYPDGITKDRFFMVTNGLYKYYKYAIYTLEKYNISPPKVDSFGI